MKKSMRSSNLLLIILYYHLLEASKYTFKKQDIPVEVQETEPIWIVKIDSTIHNASSKPIKVKYNSEHTEYENSCNSLKKLENLQEEYDDRDECWESCFDGFDSQQDFDEEKDEVFEECCAQNLQTIEHSEVSSPTHPNIIMGMVGSFFPTISPKMKMIDRRWSNLEIVETKGSKNEEQKSCLGHQAKNFVEMLKNKLVEAKNLKVSKNTAKRGAKTFIENRSATLSEYKENFLTSHSNFDVVVYEHGWWMIWHNLVGEEGLLPYDDDFALYMSEIDESAIRKEICSQWKHSRWDVEKLFDTIAVDALRAFLYKTKKDIALSAIRSGLDTSVRSTLRICGWDVNDAFMVLISAYIVKFGFLQPIQDPMYSAAETLARGVYSTAKTKVVYVARNAKNPKVLAKNVKMNFKKIVVKVLCAPLFFKKRKNRRVKRRAILNWIFRNFLLRHEFSLDLNDFDWHVLELI
jgi:hypothetical protein